MSEEKKKVTTDTEEEVEQVDNRDYKEAYFKLNDEYSNLRVSFNNLLNLYNDLFVKYLKM